jgi:outer membrane protein, heavy metal efflux system
MSLVRRGSPALGAPSHLLWPSPAALALLFVCAFAVGVAGAAEPPLPPAGGAATLPVEELVRLAVEANPAIGAARADAAAVQARSRIETTFADPALTVTWWPEKASERKQEIWEFMLEQGVPFPGRLGAVAGVVAAEETVARIGLERTIRDVTLGVRESAAEVGYLRSARAVAAGNRELLGRLRAAGEAGYAGGRTGLYDAMRAQSQQSQTVFDEQLLAELEATEIARLNSLLGRLPETPVGSIDLHPGRPVVVGLAEIAEAAASGRHEVLLALEEEKKSRAERRVADFDAYPGLMLGVGYMQESELDDMEATGRWKFELGLSLPVLFGKNTARRAQAGAGESRAAALAREAAFAARAEVREAYFRLRNAERLVGIYRDVLLPQATASLELADTWFRAGQGSFADLVEAGTLRYNFQLALARAGADREKFLARLEALAQRQLTAPPDGRSAPESSATDAEWNAALDRLEAARASFTDAGSETPGGGGLVVTDPLRLAALGTPTDDGAAAAEALFPQMSLSDLEALAVTRSPSVLSAERSLRATLEQYGQVTALDDVLRRYATATGSLMTGVGGAMGAGVRERFPFPGMLALKGEIVTQDARAAREERDRARRDALAEARRLFWGLDYASRAISLLGEINGLLRQAVQAVQAGYESGKGPLANVATAQVELEKNLTEMETVAGERVVIETGLRSLLALPRDAVLGLPRGSEPLPPAGDPAALAVLALDRRQELRRLRAEESRMERMIQMAEREVVPGFSLELSLFENSPLEQAGTMAMAEPFPSSVPAAEGIGTPVRAFSGRTAGYVRETRERLAALREEIRGAEQSTVARVREAWFAYDRARREERLWAQRVVELTRLASETMERSYRAGRATLPEALESARVARESALTAARRRADAGQAWAALEMTIGAPLSAAGSGK